MSKTTNKFSTEVRARAVRMVPDHEGEHPSRWAAILTIASKIGCTAQTMNEWVKKAEVDSGRKPGLTTEVAEKLKALERENSGRRTRSCARHQPILPRRGSTACSSDDRLHR